MPPLHPKKLLHSKWTAVGPKQKEKHFMVTKMVFDEDGNVETCIIEAIMTRREEAIDWRELKNQMLWKQGWN